MGFHDWFRVAAIVGGFLCAGHGLYAWLKLRDKPTAIQNAGSTLIIFSTMLAKWFNVVVMFVGLGLTCYGLMLVMRRVREAEEAVARSRRPASLDASREFRT